MYKWEGIVSSNHSIVTTDLEINIFPNPFSESFQFEMNFIDFEKYQKDNLTLEVFDILGKKIISQKLIVAQSNIQFPSISNGAYFYILKTKNKMLSNGNLMFYR
jgi:hypothetical protein